MKKVLVVITTAFVPYGGLTTVMMNYYRVMKKSDLQIDFASKNEIGKELTFEIAHHHSHYIQLPRRDKNYFKYFVSLLKLAKGYDIIHIHGNSATTTIELLAAKLAGVSKRIIHIHNSQCTHVHIHRMLMPLFRRLYTDAIACSELAGDWIFGKNNFLVLNNAIDTQKFAYNASVREQLQLELGLSDNELIIGHVGKLIEQKNHRFLIEVFEKVNLRHSNSKLVLVGDGVLRKELEAIIREKCLQNKVILLGMRDDIYMLLQVMDIFVFPSLWEGLPLSLLEAQAAGLPCFASDEITNEVCLTNLVSMYSLKNSSEKWADEILRINISDRRENSINACNVLKDKKYDNQVVGNDLRKIYLY